jgi:predicted PurR-regulated permease PerM
MAIKSVVARRALIGGALIAAGGAAGAIVTPIAEQGAQHEALNKAYADGVAAGKQAIINQLKQMNGVQLQAALTTAHNTRAATKVIAQPASNMLATIAGDALSAIVSVLGNAQNLLILFQDGYNLLGKLKSFFEGLQNSILSLPVPIGDLGSVDTEAATTFLEGVALIALETA